MDPDGEDDDESDNEEPTPRHSAGLHRTVEIVNDIPRQAPVRNPIAEYEGVREYKVARDYHALHDDLATNFRIMYENGEVKWPKRFSDSDKQRIPQRPDVFYRTQMELIRGLYGSDGIYDALIGQGNSFF